MQQKEFKNPLLSLGEQKEAKNSELELVVQNLSNPENGLGVPTTAASYGMSCKDFLSGAWAITKSVLKDTVRGIAAANTATMLRTTYSLLIPHLGASEESEKERTDNGIDVFKNTTYLITTILILKDMAAFYDRRSKSQAGGSSPRSQWRKGDIGPTKYIKSSYNNSPNMCSAVTNAASAFVNVAFSALDGFRQRLVRTVGRDNIIMGAGALGAVTSAVNDSLPMLGFTTNAVAAYALLPPTAEILDPKSDQFKDLTSKIATAMKEKPKIMEEFYQAMEEGRRIESGSPSH